MRNAASFSNEVFGEGISLTGIVNNQDNIGWNNFSLGRWSPLWQQAQALYYQRIGSKKSAKRWTSAIVHHLMMTRWDLWQFRNKIKHSPDGPEATDTNNDLNGQIQHELTTGPNGIKNDCHHLFEPPYTLEYLSKKSIHFKTMWLNDVWNAREAMNNEEQDQEVVDMEAQQDTMRIYLDGNIQHP